MIYLSEKIKNPKKNHLLSSKINERLSFVLENNDENKSDNPDKRIYYYSEKKELNISDKINSTYDYFNIKNELKPIKHSQSIGQLIVLKNVNIYLYESEIEVELVKSLITELILAEKSEFNKFLGVIENIERIMNTIIQQFTISGIYMFILGLCKFMQKSDGIARIFFKQAAIEFKKTSSEGKVAITELFLKAVKQRNGALSAFHDKHEKIDILNNLVTLIAGQHYIADKDIYWQLNILTSIYASNLSETSTLGARKDNQVYLFWTYYLKSLTEITNRLPKKSDYLIINSHGNENAIQLSFLNNTGENKNTRFEIPDFMNKIKNTFSNYKVVFYINCDGSNVLTNDNIGYKIGSQGKFSFSNKNPLCYAFFSSALFEPCVEKNFLFAKIFTSLFSNSAHELKISKDGEILDY